MWKFLSNYFTFTRREKNGIIILTTATVIVLLAAEVYPYLKPVKQSDNAPFEAEVKAFQQQYRDSTPIAVTPVANSNTAKPIATQPPAHKTTTGSEFYFDPNTIGIKEWMQLGFTKKQAMVIEHYKQSGGVFHKPQDIKKLYVMSEENYERLLPYVKIKNPNP